MGFPRCDGSPGHPGRISPEDRRLHVPAAHPGRPALAAWALTLRPSDSADPGFEVPVVALTDVEEVASASTIDVLKIDVEGFEAEVVAGAGPLWSDGYWGCFVFYNR